MSLPLCFSIEIGMFIVLGLTFSSAVADVTVNATGSGVSLSMIVAMIEGASEPIFALTVGLELWSVGFKVILNRQSGVHHYETAIRKLFGEKRQRPLSSSYFELIQQREL